MTNLALTGVRYQINNTQYFIEARETRGQSYQYVVWHNGAVLNNIGEFEIEPLPSNRDEAFILRTRYTSPLLALERFKKWVTKHPDSMLE